MEIQMNKFDIVDMPGMNTVAFLVERDDNEYRKGNSLFSLQKIDCVENGENGKIKKIFTVVPQDEEKQMIVLLTITNNKAILSTGELNGEGFTSKSNMVPLSYGTVYNQEGIEYKEFSYTPNMKRQFAIIDTNTGDEVKPILYVDAQTNEIRGKCKLLPLRPYVVLELRIDGK